MTMWKRLELEYKMVQALTILSALQLFSEAQKTEMPPCENGRGVLRFERLADVRRAPSSSDSDVVRLSEIPAEVLFKCQNYCLKDETSNPARTQPCGSLDFVPGKRFSTYSPTIEYTESKCFLAVPDERPSTPPKYEKAKDYYHYREVCFPGSGIDQSVAATDCPERFYVMERVMGKRFMPKGIKEHNANSLEECEQLCLNQAMDDPLMATSICRAGTFDHQRQRCYLSTFTRRTHNYDFVDDPVYDYFENTCLDVERRCPKNKLFWTKEVNAEMTGPYDFLIVQNLTLEECKAQCLTNKNVFCRSVEFDERSKTCVLSDEDSVSRPEHIRQSASEQNIYLELTCIDGYHLEPSTLMSPSEQPSQDRQPLTDRNLREVQTAFQLFRNRRLELSPGFRERGREGTRVSLAECLDACLEEKSFQCRSAIYSERHQTCRLSEFDQLNGNLGFDADYHYFENLMSDSGRTDTSFHGSRPSDDDGSGRFRPIGSGSRFDSGGSHISGTGDSFSGSRFQSGSRFSSSSRFDGKEDRFSSSDGGRFDGDEGRFSSGASGTFGSRGTSFGDTRDRGTGSFGEDRDRGTGTFGDTRDREPGHTDDRFSTAFNRFHESNLIGSGTGFGTAGSRFGGGGGGGGGSRFGSGTRVTGADRFAGGASGDVGSGGVFSSGAAFNRRGGFDTRLSGDSSRNALGSFGSSSGTAGSTFGFGSSAFGSSGFSSSSGFGPASTFGRPPFAGGSTGNAITDEISEGRFSGSGSSAYGSSFSGESNSISSSNIGSYRPGSGSGSSFSFESNFESSSFGNTGPGFRPSLSPGLSVTDTFELVGSRLRLRSPYIRRYLTVDALNECKEQCLGERSFTCMSFNYRSLTPHNCEMSDTIKAFSEVLDSRIFDRDTITEYYSRVSEESHFNTPPEVSQQCNPDGSMEFMLRTQEPFRGRIYTFGYYDRCFYRGGGSTVNMLKISPPRGFPDCGTTKYGDTTSNIVVVQFADGVMTSMDKRYNLTCTTVGPGDTLVTSSYIGAGLGAPIPIEYLPEESRLESNVRLQILYSGRPTTTVAVGDPLTFRIESLAGRGLVSDIFATNVVARDPISGRAIELIDSRGCPVQTQVFPALGKARSGDGLETRFSAFKIPESNMVVFEARVRMCKRECEPSVCNVGGRGREEVFSYGRRRRRSTDEEPQPEEEANGTVALTSTTTDEPFRHYVDDNDYDEEEANVNEVIRVYMNEEEAQEFRDVEAASLLEGVCVSPSEYYSLLSALLISIFSLCVTLSVMGFCYRKHRNIAEKNAAADVSNPLHKPRSGFPGAHPRTVNQPARYFPSQDDKGHSTIDVDVNGTSRPGHRFPDPSEPIYTDPTLFERSHQEYKESTSERL